MQLIIKGIPCAYTHECDEADRGRVMTAAELEEFAVQCLATSLRYVGVRFRMRDEKVAEEMGCDVLFESDGRWVMAHVRYFGDDQSARREFLKRIHGPSDEFAALYPKAWKWYQKSGGKTTPIFYVPEFYCFETSGGENLCGGEYMVRFMPYECRSPQLPTGGPALSEYEMHKGYAESWATGNTDFMRDYVLMDFRGESELSFLQYTSKANLLARVEHLYAEGAKPYSIYTYKMAHLPDTDENGVIFYKHGEPDAFLKLEFKYGRIHRSICREVPKQWLPWGPKRDIAEDNSYHLLPFVHPDDIGDLVQEAADTRKFYIFDRELTPEEKELDVEYLVITYGEKFRDDKYFDIAYQMLFRSRRGTPEVEFLTMFPNLFGVEVELTILEVAEWKNKLAATVRARYENQGAAFEFWFFASDYFEDPRRYRPGARWVVDLAASVEAIDIVMNAARARAAALELGEQDLDYAVVFCESDGRIPNLAELQTEVRGEVHRTRFFGRDVNWCNVPLDAATGLEVPLYFGGSIIPETGAVIEGTVWLTGSICDPNE